MPIVIIIGCKIYDGWKSFQLDLGGEKVWPVRRTRRVPCARKLTVSRVTHLKKFTKTDDNRPVVLTAFVVVVVVIVGLSFFRVVRAHVVYDGAKFQDLSANVRFRSPAAQVRLGTSDGSAAKRLVTITLKITLP